MKRRKYALIPDGKVHCGNGWCFGIVNCKLAEIFFRKPHGIWGFCYVRLNEYNKLERKMIQRDIQKYRFTYRGGYFFDRIRFTKQKEPKWKTVFPPSELKGARPIQELFKRR